MRTSTYQPTFPPGAPSELRSSPVRRPGLLAVLSLVLCFVAWPTAAAENDFDLQLEGMASLLFDEDFDETLVGLRVSTPVSRRFHAEGSLSYLSPGDLDLWVVDLSLKYFFDDHGQSRWYLKGGPGTIVEEIDDLGDTGWQFHLGVGTEIDLSRRLYLRPELLVRWSEHGDLDDAAGDLNLGVGWRF